MKKWVLLVMVVALMTLCACSAEDFEPMLDVYGPSDHAQPAKIQIDLPEDAVLSVMAGDTGTLYYGENYEVCVETYPSGNISDTLKKITGRQLSDLTVLEVPVEEGKSYRCGWSVTDGEGERIGQCVVIDDGRFHYCLSVLADAESAGQLRPVIESVLNSYRFPSY